MKIFKIQPDFSSNVQTVMPVIEEGDSYISEVNIFDCESKKESWREIEWYIFNPKQKKCNFIDMGNASLVFDKKVYDSEMFPILEMAGEIFDINVEGEQLFVLNVMECVNALDKENSKWNYYDDGSRGRLLEHAFHHKRITESSLYKIPETAKIEILTYTDVKDSLDEFKGMYESLNFTGLTFEKLFDSEDLA